MMDENNRNFLLALVLSVLVIFSWQALFMPSEEDLARQQQQQQQAAQQSQQDSTAGSGASRAPQAPAVQQGGAPTPASESAPPAAAGGASSPAAPVSAPIGQPREAVLAQSERIRIDTPNLQGSLSLTGARLDDLTLKQYRQAVDPDSPPVTLLSPSQADRPYYAEHGWTVAPNAGIQVPNAETVWTRETQGALTPSNPVTLSYDNGAGLIFQRTIAVDADYMFTVTQEVENASGEQVTLYPYALISRHGRPETSGFYILHEGLIGVMGEEGLQEIDYQDAIDERNQTFKANSGWLGITDKYWATALVPGHEKSFEAHFQAWNVNNRDHFQTDFLLGPVIIEPGATQSVSTNLFAGAKSTNLIDSYEEQLNIDRFELMIDWGWFHFMTKPLFYALDYFYGLFGNFGVSILVVTLLIKLVFFPLANKSYESMSKMKKLQPEMMRIRDRYKDDRMKQQQAMMEMYKKEKVNPMSGCLPILVQIPVFFALYKVLYITIEARHAPFFGWVQDLSAPDPTSIFNLFGLLPFTPPEFLMVGIWPLLMGVSMFIQMKLNPAPTDPIQQKIFTWMPVLFTFLLATFPAGLVIYWTWNNGLSILQQWVIMRRQGVEVNLLENIGIRKNANSTTKS